MSKKSPLKNWQYYADSFSNYAMISNDLLKADPFRELTNAERLMYLVLVTHSASSDCVTCLYWTLRAYHEKTGKVIPEIDLQEQVGTRARKKQFGSPFFVFPEKHMKQYGYTASQARKLIKALIEKGFIEKYCNDKAHCLSTENGLADFSQMPTVYRFSEKWKKDKR